MLGFGSVFVFYAIRGRAVIPYQFSYLERIVGNSLYCIRMNKPVHTTRLYTLRNRIIAFITNLPALPNYQLHQLQPRAIKTRVLHVGIIKN